MFWLGECLSYRGFELSGVYCITYLLIRKTVKSFYYKNTRVIFSKNFSQLRIYYHEQPEKPRNVSLGKSLRRN